MFKKYIHLSVLTAMLSVLGSCVSDEWADGGVTPADGDELPVEFIVSLPGTRAIENPKTAFSQGDVLHIQGTFTALYGGKEEEVIRYGALRFNGRTWEAVENSGLTWPTSATKGTFLAYFISGSDGLLYKPDGTSQERSKTDTYLLSDIKPSVTASGEYSDPLKAESGDTDYGHAVELNFEHICAYLTLEDLEPQVSDRYWFTCSGTDNGGNPFHNAFNLQLTDDNKLIFNWITEPDDRYKGPGDASRNLVYIASPAIRTENKDGKNITRANYFLKPGLYDKFQVCYPVKEPVYQGEILVTPGETLDYLEFDYTVVPDNSGGTDENDSTIENAAPDLKGGRTYTLNITRSPGIVIVTPPDAEGWDESDNDYTVDVEEFLKAVANGTEYTNQGGEKILEKTATGTKLLHNVDFKFHEYTLLEDNGELSFEPNVNEGQTFDGNYHYIKNLGSPLFRYNYGTIRNLGIKRIQATVISDENSDTGKDMSRQGGLCMWNRSSGNITNIRVSDGVEITALVKTDKDDETHNIGCLLGSNTGSMSDVALSGEFTLTVEAYVDNDITDQVDATVLIGGLSGQIAGSGRISHVSALDGVPRFTITNKCQGDIGAFYVGGIAGQSSGHIDDISLPDVTVDGSASISVTSYMGCMAGEFTVSSDADEAPNASVTACIVTGKVVAGVVKPDARGYLTGASYIGGVSGALMNVPVTDSRVAAEVHGAVSPVADVIYAAGGAFGRIRTATLVENLIAYGSALDGPNDAGITDPDERKQFIGNFAGLVPSGETWEETYSGQNIIVRQFPGLPNIAQAKDAQTKD